MNNSRRQDKTSWKETDINVQNNMRKLDIEKKTQNCNV